MVKVQISGGLLTDYIEIFARSASIIPITILLPMMYNFEIGIGRNRNLISTISRIELITKTRKELELDQ